jgi:hypothetical protein
MRPLGSGAAPLLMASSPPFALRRSIAQNLANGLPEGHSEDLIFCGDSLRLASMQSSDNQHEPGSPDPDAAEDGAQERTRYLRSTIAFPYTGLQDAEQIARALHDSWGGSASPDQLAASPTLNASPRSGAFRTKLATSRTFRIITVSRGNIALTDLGRKLVDPQTRAAARVDAFLAVPLFEALVNEFRGSTLPPDPGLEQKIRDLGVSAKQTAKARQAFQRSAELAGFFKMGKDRLVQPANLPTPDKLPGGAKEPKPVPVSSSSADLPPPLAALWLTLLREGRDWSPEKVQEFVEAARTLHGLMSKEG